jgi:ketosteroid isomerase-like protein
MSAPGRDLRETAADLIDAFNQADWERFRSHLSPDVVYLETGTGRRLEGADAYVEACREWRRALSDVHGTVLAELAGEDLVAQEVQWTATHDGPLELPSGPLAATGRHVDVRASFWARFEGDVVAEAHHHLDVLTLLGQLGALPSPAAT